MSTTTIDLLDWLSLRLSPDMTRPRFHNLMAHFKTPEAVYGSSAAEIARLRGFDAAIARGVLSGYQSDEVRRHADRLAAGSIRMVSRNCADYPANLKESSLAPPLLFVQGTLLSEDRYAIALVGSRHATQYGRAVASEFGSGLARYGMTVISGFARGVDGEAHHAALKAGGRTIAVLGNGLDTCYPSEHRSLVSKVAESGALITEYPLGTPPDRYNFPERNHVIAALALGTLVVEAAEKSGSLITARLAVEENRFVFAVPGDITRNNSRGANGLIQQGARMVQRPQEILIEMKHVLRGYLNDDLLEEEIEEAPPKKKQKTIASATTADAISDRPLSEQSALQSLPEHQPLPKPAAPDPVTFTDAENFIIGLLRHEAMVFDEIATQAYAHGIDVPRLTSLLMKLELRSIIRQMPGRYYVLFTR